MTSAFDVAFALMCFYVLTLFGLYVMALVATYDDGNLRRFMNQSILDAMSRRTVDELTALSDIERLHHVEWRAGLAKELGELSVQSDGAETRLVALLIADSPHEADQVQAVLRERSAQVNLGARHRFEQALALAETRPIKEAAKILRRATFRGRVAVGWAGISENYGAVALSSFRSLVVAGLVNIIALVVLSVLKLSMREKVTLTGDIVGLLMLAAFVLSLTISPALVFWRSAREVLTNSSKDWSPQERRAYRRLRWLVPGALVVGFFGMYFGPLPPAILPDSLSDAQVGSWASRVAAGALAAFVFLVFLRPLWSDVRTALAPSSKLTVGGAMVVTQVDGESAAGPTTVEPVLLPMSARLKMLATAAFMGPVLAMMCALALMLAVRPNIVKEQAIGDGIVWQGIFLACAALIFFAAPLLLVGGLVMTSRERQRRHEAYRALGIAVVGLRDPALVALVAVGLFILSAVVLSLFAPRSTEVAYPDLAAFAEDHPLWIVLNLLVSLAWFVGFVWLAAWWVIQARRIRRQDAELANEARIRLARFSDEGSDAPGGLA